MNLTKNTKLTRHSNAVAAGTTTITPSTAIDMKGFDAVTFIAAFGTLTSTAVTSVEVHQSASSSSGFTALKDSKVSIPDTDSNKLVYVEVNRPQKRYVKLVV